MYVIEDGKGTGNKAQVTNNKLQVDAVASPKLAEVSEYEGLAYLIVSGGFTSLTTVTEHGLLYIKYTGEKALHINSIRTCGTGQQKWKMYKNPTGGTLISGATSATVTNMNFTSSNILSATVYKGADSSTVSGGTVVENWINASGHSIELLEGALILGKNDSIALSCENAGSIDVCIRINCYEHGE